MRKNGFIATSILYSFFLVFVTLFVALITNYLHNKILLDAVDEMAKEMVYSINNLKFTDLEVGDSISFANVPTPPGGYDFSLNDTAKWIVGYIETSGTKKKYYLLSDFTAQRPVVTRQLTGQKARFKHTITIDVMNYLSSSLTDGYRNDISFYVSGVANRVFTSNDFKVYIPTASKLVAIRNSNISEDIKSSILGVNGDYVIYLDGKYGNFPYTAGVNRYAVIRRYNFQMGDVQSKFVPSYCHASFNGTKVTYNSDNVFGYTHVMDSITNKSGTQPSYVDYCMYSSPTAYTHKRADMIVSADETKANDIIEQTFAASTYQYRLMMEVNVDVNADNIYLSGGRGTSVDPYLITNGVKVK